MITVVTGFSPAGHIEYGQRFLDTFEKYWPKDIMLNVYVEQPITAPRARVISLFECGGVGDFIARHKDDAERNGRKPNERWRERHRIGGYNFKFDAVKFCRQCFIPRQAARYMADGDILVWLDGDVVTLSDVPSHFIPSLLGDSDIVFLGRQRMHSEIGFWAVRLNERTRGFLAMFAEVWERDEVFSLPEWHSAFVFDHCRRKFSLRENNLTPNGTGHVWFQSPLAKYTDHCKGNRKTLGHSPEGKRK